jgi:MFS family permease
VVYICSVLIGIGAAILWVAQGAFITRCSDDDTRGRNSGVFWAIFQVSGVVGNLAAYFILQNETNVAWLFAIFLVVGVAGVVILLFLQEVPSVAPPTLRKSLLELLLESLRMMVFDKDMLLLLPVMFFTGFELSFYSGTFPKLIIPTKDVGLVMTSFGAAEVICGLLVGKLSDHVSRKIIVMFACVAYTGALVLSWLLLQHPSQQLFAYGAAVCVGIGDSTFNTQIYATLGTLYPGSDAVSAFTIFQFVQNVGSAVGFFYEPLLPLGLGTSGSLIQLYIVFGVGVLGTFLYLFVNLTPREQRMREV